MQRALGLGVMLMALSGCTPGMLDGLEEGRATEPPDADRVLIGTIQGAGDTSPLLDRDVAIEGVVVRSLMGDGDDMAYEAGIAVGAEVPGQVEGWFIQDEGDGLEATSDAIFVKAQPSRTIYSMSTDTKHTSRIGSTVRTGDRVKVRGTVAEVAQDAAADQRRSSGHPVSRGEPSGTVTTINADLITLLSERDRKTALVLAPLPRADQHEESAEGMRLEPAHPDNAH